MIRRVYSRDPVYSLLLTFGLAFIIQDVCRYIWGPNGLPLGVPDALSQPLSSDLFFITWYRIFMVAVVIVAVAGLFAFLRYHAGGRAHPRRHARSGNRRRRSASTCGCCARSISASARLLAGLAGVLAGGQIGLNPNMGDDLLMPSFIAIIVGGVGSLTGTLFGGLLIGRRRGADHRGLPGRQRGGDLRHHGGGAADPPARPDGRGRHADMNSATTAVAAIKRPAERRWLPLVAIWVVLLAVPLWLPLVGGYTALAGRVLVLGLAAMAFNLLLGFTGVMSFGHAAYFGLGAYGAGLTLKYPRRVARRSPCCSARCSAASPARCSGC